MISKTIVHAASVCLFALLCALIAFAGSETWDRGRVPAGNSAAPVRETDVASDGLIVGSGEGPFKRVGDACADSIANCGDPVKHLGTQNGCACFACSYGTASQHSICTRNAADKDALLRRAR